MDLHDESGSSLVEDDLSSDAECCGSTKGEQRPSAYTSDGASQYGHTTLTSPVGSEMHEHYVNSVNADFVKMRHYYTLADKTCLYRIAVALHPECRST